MHYYNNVFQSTWVNYTQHIGTEESCWEHHEINLKFGKDKYKYILKHKN